MVKLLLFLRRSEGGVVEAVEVEVERVGSSTVEEGEDWTVVSAALGAEEPCTSWGSVGGLLLSPLPEADTTREGSTVLTTTTASTGRGRGVSSSTTTIGTDGGAAVGAGAGARAGTSGAEVPRDLARVTKQAKQGQTWGQK
jgi:hypothetical protein